MVARLICGDAIIARLTLTTCANIFVLISCDAIVARSIQNNYCLNNCVTDVAAVIRWMMLLPLFVDINIVAFVVMLD